uniref:glutamate receptor-interacting protein 1-like n=1 Tax=Myxine glutinosa TaxID=7769 RepID=UPI00358E3A2D
MPAWRRNLRLCLQPVREDDDQPYTSQGAQLCPLERVELHRRPGIPEEVKGRTTLELIKKDGSSLGLTISGGADKDEPPRVSDLRLGGIAIRSDQLNVGDHIHAVNGIALGRLHHAEIVSLLRNIGGRVCLDVEYELPAATVDSSSVTPKSLELSLQKEGNSFGIVIRGGAHEERYKCRPVVITHVRAGGPADREGSLRAGDRLLAVDGLWLRGLSLTEAISRLKQCGQEVILHVEYDVSIMDSVQKASGPLLVELSRSPGAGLGIQLGLGPTGPFAHPAIIIEGVRPASVAERCGALHTGDHVLSIDGVATELCSLQEASQLLANASDTLRLEILPARRSITGLIHKDRALVSAAFSPSALRAHSLSSLGSTTLPRWGCAGSVHGSLPRHRLKKAFPSSISTASSSLGLGGQVVRTENVVVELQGGFSGGLGIQIQGGLFPSETLASPPIITCVESKSEAERCGLLQIGDRLLAVNGLHTEGGTLEDAQHLLHSAGLSRHVTLDVEFDVAESVIPSSGTFHVKLPSKRGMDLGVSIAAPPNRKPGDAPIITGVKKGSVAHRTGTLAPGDRLLAIDGERLEVSSVERAIRALQRADSFVRLKICKSEENADCDDEDAETVSYTVQLNGSGGPLGIDITATKGSFEPILVSTLTKGGLAERTGAIHVGDRILSINGMTLKGQSASAVNAMLQSGGESVSLTIRKHSPSVAAGGATPAEQRRWQASQPLRSTELPSLTTMSLDSAVDSWDGSAEVEVASLLERPETEDRVFRYKGATSAKPVFTQDTPAPSSRYPVFSDTISPSCRTAQDICLPCQHPASTVSLNGSRWRDAVRGLSADSPTDASFHRVSSEPGSSDDDWDRDGMRLQQDDPPLRSSGKESSWLQLIRDLERFGESAPQSRSEDPRSWDHLPHESGAENEDCNRFPLVSEACQSLEQIKLSLRRAPGVDGFGFSVADGVLEPGVFVSAIRPGGAAEAVGLQPYDRILQVNHVVTRDFDCTRVVPLLSGSAPRLFLLVGRDAEPSPRMKALLPQSSNRGLTHTWGTRERLWDGAARGVGMML